MATRRKPPSQPAGSEGDGTEELETMGLVDAEIEEQTAADRVMHMLTDVAGDDRAKMTVHQVLPSGKEAWCEDYAPHDYELGGMKMIRDKWGAGNFKVRLYGVRDGHFGILTSATIEVKESKTPSVAPAPNNDALRLIAEGQQQMLRALTERPTIDPMADMAKMFGMMKLMREAMGLDTQTPAPQRSSVAELIDAIKELRGASELISPTGNEGNDDSLMSMAKAFLPAIATMAGNRRVGAAELAAVPALPIHLEQQPLPASLAAVDRTPAAVTTWPDLDESAPTEIPTGTNDVGHITSEALTAFKLKAYLQSLVMMARTRVPTDKGAELVYSKLPDEWIDMLDLPTWWELFSQACPDAVPYRQWFTETRDKALKLFEDEEDEPTTATATTATAP